MSERTPNSLNNYRARLRQRLLKESRWLIALSGGVDSAVLLAETTAAIGPGRVLAVTGVSPAVPESDRIAARDVCEGLEVEHRFVPTAELARPEYRRNSPDRCFHCRKELFTVLERVCRDAEPGYRVAYGAIVDDLGDHRPGMQAATEMGVAAPLLETGIGKATIRELARYHGLSVSEKPAAACLASRIRTGIEVNETRLGQVERAEALLAGLGFRQFRVRHHGELARIELGPGGLELLAQNGMRSQVATGVAAAGFRFVTVDLLGYRPAGSENAPGAGHDPGMAEA